MVLAYQGAKKPLRALYGLLWRSEGAINLFFAKKLSQPLNKRLLCRDGQDWQISLLFGAAFAETVTRLARFCVQCPSVCGYLMQVLGWLRFRSAMG
jgi:hypothetical protein